MKNGILDGLSGKIGPVVTYQWKGRDCVRSREVVYQDPKTPKQLNRRKLFGAASKLASAMWAAVEIGYRGPALAGQTTERGCFMRANHHCLSLDGDTVSIDYASLQLASGPLAAVHFATPQAGEGCMVSVAFQSESGGEGGDYVLLFAYDPTLGRERLSLPVHRCSGLVTVTLPTLWTGHTVHLYGFTWDNAHTASDSSYLERITLTH